MLTSKKTVNDTHEAYVSFDVAELLSDLKFDWNTRMAYYVGEDPTFYGKLIDVTIAKISDPTIPAPSLDVAQRYFRQIYKLHITIYSSSQESWMFRITEPHQQLENGIYGEDFETYERALNAAIKECSEVILRAQNS